MVTEEKFKEIIQLVKIWIFYYATSSTSTCPMTEGYEDWKNKNIFNQKMRIYCPTIEQHKLSILVRKFY